MPVLTNPDKWLLGTSWNGQTYIDTVLPCDLRLPPIHYLDDYLLLGLPKSLEYQRALKTTLTCCQYLKVPVADHITEGPSTQLVFLRIKIDFVNRILRGSSTGCRRRSGTGAGRHSRRKKALLSLVSYNMCAA